MISGYLFHNDISYTAFWKKKVGIFVPWIVWGILIWLYEVARKGFGYANLFEWLLGIGTYLWYMPVVIIFWGIFYFVKSKKLLCSLFIMFLVYNIVAYYMGWHVAIGKINTINDVLVSAPYFLFGMLMREAWREHIITLYHNHRFICIGFTIVAEIMSVMWLPTVIFIFVSLLLCFEMGELIQKSKMNTVFLYLGENSYLIYLIHIPFAGIVSNIFSRNAITLYLVLLQPIIVCLCAGVVVYILKIVCRNKRKLAFIMGIPNQIKA